MNRPWMPLYVADYLADTTHLRALDSGAYLHLIMHYWQHGSLPDNDRKLSAIAKLSDREWKRTKPTLAEFFHDGWHHKRIDGELAKAADISSKRAASAKQRHSNSSAIASQMDTHTRASSPSQRKEDAADAALISEEADYFRRGKQILGANSGGLLAQLKAAKTGNVALARAAIEQATTKQNPREYLMRVIRGQAATEADQNKKIEEVMRQKGSAVVFATEIPGGIPGIG